MIKTLKQHQFLFRELVKRDFRQKYNTWQCACTDSRVYLEHSQSTGRISGVDADF